MSDSADTPGSASPTRAERAEDLRQLATWLEANPDVPWPYQLGDHSAVSVMLIHHDPADAIAIVERYAVALGRVTVRRYGSTVAFDMPFGSITLGFLTRQDQVTAAQRDPKLPLRVDLTGVEVTGS